MIILILILFALACLSPLAIYCLVRLGVPFLKFVIVVLAAHFVFEEIVKRKAVK